MKPVVILSVLAVVVAGATVPLASAVAQAPAAMRNPQIAIAYVEPADAAYRPIYERLKARHVLEQLSAFLSPLRLPRKIEARTEQCNQPNKDYEPGGAVTICYEYVAHLEKLAEKIPANARTARGVSREDAVVGAFVQIVLHEMSHAVIEAYKLPVWGREEDAADKLAGFLMLQFGTEIARRTLNGAAYFFEASDRTWTGNDFSDVRGTEAQRFYNYLCIAYGGDQDAFKDFVQDDGQSGRSSGVQAAATRQRTDLLPARRAARCPKEYSDLKYAFEITVLPQVDQGMMQKVLARKDWLQ